MKLLFSMTEWSFFSWAIRQMTWSDWSHVEVFTPDGQLLGADFWDGVSVRTLDNRIKKSDKFLLCDFDIPEEKQGEFLHLLHGQLGKRYDLPGIFGHLFRTEWEHTGKWVCSELPAAMAAMVNYPIVNIYRGRSNRITPRDLLLSNRIKRITDDVGEIKSILKSDQKKIT